MTRLWSLDLVMGREPRRISGIVAAKRWAFGRWGGVPLLWVAISAPFCVFAEASPIPLIPGMSGKILVPVDNRPESGGAAERIIISTEANEAVSIQSGSDMGPIDIPVGASHVFSLNYLVANTTQTFATLRMEVIPSTTNVTPAVWNTQVDYKRPPGGPAVDIDYINSRASGSGAQWQVQLIVNSYSIFGMDRIELWRTTETHPSGFSTILGTVISTTIVSDNGSSPSQTTISFDASFADAAADSNICPVQFKMKHFRPQFG